jgi:hypothetical protein
VLAQVYIKMGHHALAGRAGLAGMYGGGPRPKG